jgi:tRNA(Ile2)-agmatinylcytidine synthase
MILQLGFDDTDSIKGGCTTYISALIIEKLHNIGAFLVDYPNLIRLNPNVPWKTRGNGALCLRIKCLHAQYKEIKEITIKTVEENTDLSCVGTNPGIVLLTGDIPNEIEDFSERTIKSLVQKDEALELIQKYNGEAIGFKKSRGIIGGLAAIGNKLLGDHSYEFISYRTPENWGTPRKVDNISVYKMDAKIGRSSFNNIDPETGRVLITPRGPDPILYGIRGETPEIVKHAHELINSREAIDRWVIFRTNQGTDAHLKDTISICNVKAHHPVKLCGEVIGNPRIIRGGHVIIQIKDKSGKIDCAAYKPTGDLWRAVKMLKVGDIIEAYGGVRPSYQGNPLTVNLEKIRVIKLSPDNKFQNPICQFCGKRTKSMGKNQGFECKRCHYHGVNLEKVVISIERSLKKKLYITSPRSQRHLIKPFVRYGLEKSFQKCFNDIIPFDLLSSY